MAGGNPVWRAAAKQEFRTAERCSILETYNTATDESLSIARARVEPGTTTAWHVVEHTVERYIVVEGAGRVEIGDFAAADVVAGDIVIIPAGTRQRICNMGTADLVLYCVCTPRFRSENYHALE